jgi:hypothetical protein
MKAGRAATRLARDVAWRSAALGRAISVDERLLDRSDAFPLSRPGIWSANRKCRLVRAGDGWIAVNLAREADHDLLPAWTGIRFGGDVWPGLIRWARHRPAAEISGQAALLGLPVARVGEAGQGSLDVPLIPMGTPGPVGCEVIDLSGLWAGPLCGALMAQAGFAVTKVESSQRPDSTRQAMPQFDAQLNGTKSRIVCDFANGRERGYLRGRILEAGVVITSARPRAFEQLGMSPQQMFAQRPGLVWIAISGYGWTGDGANRVAFGDDAAAAGALLRLTAAGKPRFTGDALGDPLTGMAAAAAAFDAIAKGGGLLVDAALSAVSAGAARI